MDNQHIFHSIVARSIVLHTVTYMLMGLIFAFMVFDYRAFFAGTGLKHLMRSVDSTWVMAGPLIQPIRGLIFGSVIYPFREAIFPSPRGWLPMWWMLSGIGIIGTFGPSPGSLEGFIYTVLPLEVHLTGLPEVLIQSFLFSFALHYWVNHPVRKWMNWTLYILFVLTLMFPLLGLLAGRPS